MQPNSPCKLFGAHRVMQSVQGIVPLIHLTTGCSWGTLSLASSRSQASICHSCSVLYEEEVIYGGERALMETLEETAGLFDAEVIAVLSGCIPSIMGDEVEAVTGEGEKKTRRRIISVDVPGFAGDDDAGAEAALYALSDLVRDPPEDSPAGVNIIGILGDEPRACADTKEITAALGRENIRTFIPGCTVKELAASSSALLNVVVGPGRSLAEEMQARYGTPYLEIEYPYGVFGTRNFVEVILGKLGLPLDQRLDVMEVEALADLRKAYLSFHGLQGVPVEIRGSEKRSRSLARFLSEEVQMDAYAATPGEQADDETAEFRRPGPCLVFGSSFDREECERQGLPLIRYAYPVFDSVFLDHRPFAGFSGAVGCIQDCINALMTALTVPGCWGPG